MASTIHDKPNTELFHELSRELIRAGKSFRFRAVGVSMTPTIRNGEILHVERVRPEELKKGDIVLFREGPNFRAHRLVRLDRENEIFTTRGDASVEDDASIRREQIVGKVTAKEESLSGATRIVSLRRLRSRIRNRIKRVGIPMVRAVRRTVAPLGLRTFMKALPLRLLPHLLLALIVLPLASFGQVAFDNAASAGARLHTGFGAVTSITVNLNVGAGTNRLLIVGVSINRLNNNALAVNTVTDGASTLSFLGSQADAGSDRIVEMYSLVAPPTGANSIVVSFSNVTTTNIGAVVGAASFAGVDQGTPLGAFTSAAGASGTNPTVTVTSGVGQMVIDTIAITGNRTANPGTGQTTRWNRNDGNNNTNTDVYGFGSTETGAATVTMSETLSGTSTWAMGAVSILPAALPPLTVPFTVAGTNNVLIVGVSMNITPDTGATVSSVTYNGVPLTLAGSHNDAGNLLKRRSSLAPGRDVV